MRFIDEVEIRCISGKGGAGAISFRREMHVPRGGPDGGDGGRGGDVILAATSRRNTLEHLRGQRVYKANSGQQGRPRNMTGRGGDDLRIEVPVGTMVFDQETDLQLVDLTEDGAEVVLCRGGQGGRGNIHFKSAQNRTPRRADEGGACDDRSVRLELKLLADVGLLGFPNAGKSTLISRVSNARPRVADYPFTTLVPNLGVVSKGFDASFVIADIPGLVEGASEGVGLGHQFLKHVERCRFFIHLVSATSVDEPVEDPVERYRAINRELVNFDAELATRPQIVALTKADAVDPERLAELKARLLEEEGVRARIISSVSGEGLEDLMNECWARLQGMLAEQDAT